VSMDGGMLFRACAANDGHGLLVTEAGDYGRGGCEDCLPVCTLSEYLGVEPVEPPEPDAEEVRRALDESEHLIKSPESLRQIHSAARCWLRERERKQGGG